VAEWVSFDVTGEWWDSGAESFGAVDASVRADLSQRLSASLGTGYWLYKVDELTREERTDVQAWFVGLDYHLGDHVLLGVDYAFEDDELDRYHVLDATVRWSF
jgi:hypothetical protein